MLPSVDRWKRLETLFYESLQLPPEARSAFLAESCGSDTKLREEVEDLLKEAEGSMDLLQQPISDAAQGLVAETERDLAPGTALDHYEVISLLARGGMGQVYLAEDTILKRKVALKVLAPNS
jgi:non-specific serine/threonine protein kinase/serine/threonine-protein kinase